jgi:hypothetical protein
VRPSFHRAHHCPLQWPSGIKFGARKSTRQQHQHLRCEIALSEGVIDPVVHFADLMLGTYIASVRLQPQRFERPFKNEGIGLDHPVIRALALRLSEQPLDDFGGGASFREHGAGRQRLLARLGSGFQLLAYQLCDLGYGGPRHRSRLLPSVVGGRLRLRNGEAHPLLIDRFAGLLDFPPRRASR